MQFIVLQVSFREHIFNFHQLGQKAFSRPQKSVLQHHCLFIITAIIQFSEFRHLAFSTHMLGLRIKAKQMRIFVLRYFSSISICYM